MAEPSTWAPQAGKPEEAAARYPEGAEEARGQCRARSRLPKHACLPPGWGGPAAGLRWPRYPSWK